MGESPRARALPYVALAVALQQQPQVAVQLRELEQRHPLAQVQRALLPPLLHRRQGLRRVHHLLVAQALQVRHLRRLEASEALQHHPVVQLGVGQGRHHRRRRVLLLQLQVHLPQTALVHGPLVRLALPQPALQQQRRLWRAAVRLRQVQQQHGRQARLGLAAQHALQQRLHAVGARQRPVATARLRGEGQRRRGAPLLVVAVHLLPHGVRTHAALCEGNVARQEARQRLRQPQLLVAREGEPGAGEGLHPNAVRDAHVGVGQLDQVLDNGAATETRGLLLHGHRLLHAVGRGALRGTDAQRGEALHPRREAHGVRAVHGAQQDLVEERQPLALVGVEACLR